VTFRGASARAAVLTAAIVMGGSTPAQDTQTSPDVSQYMSEDSAFIWYVGSGDVAGDADDWFVSDFAIQKESFRTRWSRQAVRIIDGALVLPLLPAPEDDAKDFIGSEVQRRQRTLYGRYEVEMTAARGEGVISSFFTYTGPYFGDPHDEIDFEFLGRDTTKVWVNRFVDGENLPGQWIDLGFDAAEGPHLYAFEWSPEEIVWFAEGRELLRISADEMAIPSRPSKIYINIWAGNQWQRGWSGMAPDDQMAQARYYCLSYQPLGAETRQCSDRDAP
jgi:beta-glucanase (GH16 family)